MASNPWEMDWSNPQGGPVYGPAPDPADARDETRENERIALERERLQLAKDEAARKAAEDAEKIGKQDRSKTSAAEKLKLVIDKIDSVALDAADNEGWFETGTSGSLMRGYGPEGTAATDLAKNIQTIDANSAFTALQEMRDNSPTGGALGQVTEKELDLLKSSVSNLDPNQSQGQFIENLANAKKRYMEMLDRIEPGATQAYANRKGIRWNEQGLPLLVYTDGEDQRDPRIIPGGTPPEAPTDGGGYSLDSIATALKAGVGDIVEGAAGIPAMFGNAANAGINAAFGTNLSTDLAGDFRGQLGLPENNNRIASAVNQGASSALTGAGGARGLAQLVNPGAYQNAMLAFGRTPIRDAAAGGGAGAGAEVTKDYGPVAQTGGAIAGGLLGYGGANAMVRGMTPMAPTPLAQAATRQGVDLLPADAGGPVARGVTTGTKASPISVAPVVKQAQVTQGQMASAADRVARGQGDNISTDVAGQNVRNAAERYTKQTSERGSRLYDRAFELSKGVKIKPLRTIAALDNEIARMQQNPDPAAAGSLRELTAFRDSIAGGVSVQGLRDARTSLSQGVYDGKLRSGADQARYKAILNNVAGDISDGLKEAGREEAANLFGRADEFWKGRVEHIDQVLQPILGRDKGGEQIVQTLETMARGGQGGNARLGRLLANMDEKEAGQVRATIVDRLGKAAPGQQNAEGSAFSASTFLTNWNKMTPQAKASLFQDKGLRRDLNDIATLAESMKASQQMANHSNTGAAVYGNMGAGVILTMAHPAAAIFGAGAQFATGRLMASPGFARILARTAKMPPETANRKLTEQLGILAGREPLLAADARALQQHLQQSFGQSPVRAVAGEEEQN